MKQFTKKQALDFAESRVWLDMTSRQIVELQLFQKKLCMPFNVFYEAIEKELGRPVWTHEFCEPDNLKKEFLGQREAPSLEAIMNKIPEEKRIIILTKEPQS